ncbi:MAG TPA: hypothetical protein VKS98_05810, partial [Chthoniobacterales bacterium]|nr:hypothetical protein [Chthoniobacterales bacterium]
MSPSLRIISAKYGHTVGQMPLPDAPPAQPTPSVPGFFGAYLSPAKGERKFKEKDPQTGAIVIWQLEKVNGKDAWMPVKQLEPGEIEPAPTPEQVPPDETKVAPPSPREVVALLNDKDLKAYVNGVDNKDVLAR